MFMILLVPLSQAGPNIIFDTDIGGDADDLGALAMLHNLENANECEILAITCVAPDLYAVPAIDAISHYYGNGHIPIGIVDTKLEELEWGYNKVIARQLPYHRTTEEAPRAVDVYRKVLADAEDKSVTILAVGHLTNLYNLMHSGGDKYSPLTGPELIAKKVYRCVMNVGEFPVGINKNNVHKAPKHADYVFKHLDVPIVFVNSEVGHPVKTGLGIKDLNRDHPLHIGFDHYFKNAPWEVNATWKEEHEKGKFRNRASMDQATTLYTVRNRIGVYFEKVENGYNEIDLATSNNRWVETDKETNQSYIRLITPPESLAPEISRIMLGNIEEKKGKVRLIFDTDIGGDIDDMSALVMLHNLENAGECEILAVMCVTGDKYAVPAVDAINRFYGNAEVPIGMQKTALEVVDWGYNRLVSEHYPHERAPGEAPSAVRLCRKILAGEEDHSIKIVTVGPLTNIRNLMKSGPDEVSELSGKELLTKKVREFVIMGGQLPEAAKARYNIRADPEAASYVFENLDVPVVYVGWEVGMAIKTGIKVGDMDPSHPLHRAHRQYFNNAPWEVNADWLTEEEKGKFRSKASFDQAAVLYAVRSRVGRYWERVGGGYNEVDTASGKNRWVVTEGKEQSYLRLIAPPEEPAKEIERIMIGDMP
jgi:inosine-uridine nucleoside N-ribohydrolase